MTEQTPITSSPFALNPVGNTLPALTPLADFSKKYPNLALSLLCTTLADPSAPAIVDGDTSISAIELLGRAMALALVLAPRLGDNKHVGILLPPSPAAVTANLAVTLLGKVAVNINYGTKDVIANYTEVNSGVGFVISSPAFLSTVNLTLVKPVIDIAELATQAAVPEVQQGVREKLQLMIAALPEALMGGTPFLAPEFADFAGLNAKLSDTAAVLYTSGSTTMPKGTVLSQRSIITNIAAISQQFPQRSDASGKPVQEVILGSLTFAHSLGYTGTLWAARLLGYKAIYLANPLDSRAICTAVEKHKVTIFISAPTLMRIYLMRAKKEQFASVEVLLLGSEKLRPELRRDIRAKLDKEACEAYGATETGPIMTLSLPRMLIGANGKEVWGSREGSVGLPVPGTEVAVVDLSTDALVTGFGPQCQGEFWVKGSQVMDGYLDRPEATAQALVGGWYRTSDIGYIDEDGFLYITDRLARWAKIGPEKVPMGYLETLMRKLSGQDELSVHVTNISDPVKGERLIVFYTNLGEASPATIVESLGAQLSPLWVPKASDFLPIEKMPVGATGKLDMLALKTLAKERFA